MGRVKRMQIKLRNGKPLIKCRFVGFFIIDKVLRVYKYIRVTWTSLKQYKLRFSKLAFKR